MTLYKYSIEQYITEIQDMKNLHVEFLTQRSQSDEKLERKYDIP